MPHPPDALDAMAGARRGLRDHADDPFCANAQRAVLANARSSFKIRHTATATDRVQQARDQLGLTSKYVAEFETRAERMINETLNEAEFRKICDDIWAPPTDTASHRSKTIAGNRTQALDRLFLDADTNTTIRGTSWAGYQAIAEYRATPPP